MRRVAAASFGLLVFLFAATAGAVQPDEMLKDPALEARARALSEQIRCLVCQNESIDDSEASLAHDLRVLIRKQIKEGRTNAQIRTFLVQRYGTFVLLKPPFRASTLVLWLGPLVVLLAGAAGMALYFRSRKREAAPADALSPKELARVERLLRGGDGPA
jgi:cytochrome c-type biogenesis protein CcmH